MKAFRFPLALTVLAAIFIAALLLGGPGDGADPRVLMVFRSPDLIPAARLLTHLGDWWTAIVAGALAAAVLAYRRRLSLAALLLFIILSEKAIVELLKWELDRARPDPTGRMVAVHNMAFPSGHSANSMTLWLALALLVAPRRYRGAAVSAALAIAAITGVCRLILQVHWPSDVIGGWAFGAFWVLLLVRFIEREPSPASPHSSADNESQR
ncbi:MAG TPA: phosphatase PAP2 family protein [Allosphingosinicella sp.]|nr:phosphatase PAP2 family protein [Allosphingosinicella sp.]